MKIPWKYCENNEKHCDNIGHRRSMSLLKVFFFMLNWVNYQFYKNAPVESFSCSDWENAKLRTNLMTWSLLDKNRLSLPGKQSEKDGSHQNLAPYSSIILFSVEMTASVSLS